VDGAGERFREGCGLKADVIGNFIDITFNHHTILGICPIDMNAHGGEVHTQMFFSHPAIVASPADPIRIYRHRSPI
jgi:hypothetical protein